MPEFLSEELGKQRYVYAAFAAYLASLSIGTSIGFASPAAEELQEQFIEDFDSSLFGSLLTIGALIGGLIASIPAERFGRKTTILGTTVLFSIGWVLIFLRANSSMLYAARFVLGLACGINCMIVPVYLGEVSPPERRGVLGTGHQFGMVIGILVIYCFGAVLRPTALALVCFIPTVCNSVAMLFVPESPTWLVKVGKKNQQVMDSLYFLFGRTVYAEAQREILTEAKEQATEKFSITDMVSRPVLKPLLLALSLMFFQQLSGINAVIFYTRDIFKDAKTSMDENVEAIIIAGIQAVFTVPATILIDRSGRRLLLLISGIFQVIGLGSLVTYYVLRTHGLEGGLQSLPVVALSLYIGGFAIGYGPVPWLMMSELLPVRARGLGTSLCTAFNWFCAFLVTKYFPVIKDQLSGATAYSIFLGIVIVGIVYVFICLPETKGKSLEEIEAIFRGTHLTASVATIESAQSQIGVP